MPLYEYKCKSCGALFEVRQKFVDEPLKTHDVCGGEVIQRQDDTEDAIRRRLELYERQTTPLIEWYELRGQLATVSGMGSPDAVLRRIIRATEDRRNNGQPR